MDSLIRNAILKIIEDNIQLISIAVGQRAKFEGWLKFELVGYLNNIGLSNIVIEPNYKDSNSRADLGLTYNDVDYKIELKTPNTSWSINGIDRKRKNITKNFNSIINDTKKLRGYDENGVVAFILFPIPISCNRWIEYLDRISNEIDINLNEEHYNRVKIPIGNDSFCEVIVCCFNV